MPRTVLIAHPNPSIRNQLTDFLKTDFLPVSISEVTSGEGILDQLKQKAYDVLIMADLFEDSIVSQLLLNIEDILRTKSRIIMVIAESNDQLIQHYQEQGVEQFIRLPLVRDELTHCVHRICPPVSRRVYERYFLPQGSLFLHDQPQNINARIINLSRGGLLCEIAFHQQKLDLLKEIEIDISLPESYPHSEIKGIGCRMSRLDVLGGSYAEFAEYLRISFIFTRLTSSDEKIIEQILEQCRD